ncbi:hypothetical protein GW17_00017400 [Ensete ventricosum]|nr:hypothetical protein GW17_00017400 [Ensete ventricosum]
MREVWILCLQAKEDGDKPGLEAMLRKVLQIYASKILRKRSYVFKGKRGKVLAAEKFLETIMEGNLHLAYCPTH